jgi:HKD family nuclease
MEFIDNVGPNTVQAALLHLLPNATTAELHVAFATSEGVTRLLRRLRRPREVRVLVSLWQAFTEPKALRLLLEVQGGAGGRLQVRVILERFHRKLYVISRRTRLDVIVGSANLTAEGLNARDELSVLFGVKQGSAAASAVRSTLDRWWDLGAPLNAEIIRAYERLRRSVPPRPKVSLLDLRQLISEGRSRSSTRSGSPSNVANRLWIDSIAGYAQEPTKQIINDETNWDRRGWDWYSCGRRAMRKGDRILLLDWAGSTPWAEVVEVTDSVKTAVPTPDGRYFAAYKAERRRRRRQLTTKARASLRTVGIGRKQYFEQVSPRRWQAVLAALELG